MGGGEGDGEQETTMQQDDQSAAAVAAVAMEKKKPDFPSHPIRSARTQSFIRLHAIICPAKKTLLFPPELNKRLRLRVGVRLQP